MREKIERTRSLGSGLPPEQTVGGPWMYFAETNSIKMRHYISILSLAIGLFTSSVLRADLVANWNFNDSNLTVDNGSGTLTSNFAASNITYFGGSTNNAYGGAAAGNALALQGGTSNANNGKYIQFTLDMSGYQDLVLSYTHQRTSTGFNSQVWSYSTDGSSFTNFQTISSIPPSFGAAVTVDFSSVAALDNDATIYIRMTLTGATSDSGNNRLDNIQFNATAYTPPSSNNSTIAVASGSSSVAFGRVMQNSTPATQTAALTKTGSDSTTYTASGNNNGVSVGADGSIAAGSQTENLTVGLANNANGTGSTGVKNYTIAVDNTAGTSAAAGQGSADPNDTINVTATVVANRTVTGASVDDAPNDIIGISGKKVLVGATLSGAATIGTSGDRDHFADVTVNAGTSTSNGVSVTVGTGTTFNDANDTAHADVSGIWTSAGTKSGSVSLGVTGEAGLSGQTAAATVTYSNVQVLEAISLVAQVNGGSPIVDLSVDAGDLVIIENEIASTGNAADRADAVVTAVNSGTSGFYFDGITAGAAIVAGGGGAVGQIGLDSANRLSGVHSANIRVEFDYADQSIVGIQAVGSLVWAATGTVAPGSTAVTGQVLTAAALANHTLNFSTTHEAGSETMMETFGTASADLAQISVEFNVGSPASNVFSDILSLNGTGSQVFVLQLSYDVDAVAALGGDIAPVVGYLSGGQWQNAVDGFGVGSLLTAGLQGYEGSFLAALGVPDLSGVNLADYLGAYGFDSTTGKAWAIINHSSDFAVVAIPEPSTWALLGIGVAFLLYGRRRRRVLLK